MASVHTEQFSNSESANGVLVQGTEAPNRTHTGFFDAISQLALTQKRNRQRNSEKVSR
ncbi:MAG: hypothetical protein VB954_04880 [Thalassolituus sp.]|jgi:hypothetical protein|uniref:Uncharacterized protein n=2 Tax=root TaxID=1 RepID=M5DPA6_9GAMM|nr:hypothetical protein [Thalassolituus oleivorans]AHK17762.1 hypothetical protein R615_13295 [Thalassolituus oleivorans R6-15]MBQ0726433.1 hypothetical protein [Thalassolituus oleivorans]MBQ0781023.1 hypothetical protein [Thalassolituus oleivorans]MDF1640407.1 hypothetical protein [Thalassolituus oleivorans]CCU71261.1 hypothetical protein TOL_0823 [Thalassolituus oleivorans MIL-1]|tara:strand:- start:1 stop:174 length:174 start_codon:yes stop_codon:yes gene_type:complete